MNNLMFKISSSGEKSTSRDYLSIFIFLFFTIIIPVLLGIIFPQKPYWWVYCIGFIFLYLLIDFFVFKHKRNKRKYGELYFNEQDILINLLNKKISYNYSDTKIALRYSGYKNEIKPFGIFTIDSGTDNEIEILKQDSREVYGFISTEADDYNKLYVYITKIIPSSVDCKLTVKGHLEFVRINGEIVNPKEHKKTWHW